MRLPSKISARGGSSATVPAAMWNELIDYLRSTRISPSVGVRPIVTSQGTVLIAPRQKISGGASTVMHPWKIHNMTGVGQPDDKGNYNSYEFQVWPGTINGLIPTNLFDGNELRKFTSNQSLQNVMLKCTSNGKELNACTIEVMASPPTPDSAVLYGVPSNLNILLGAIYKDIAFQVEFDNLSATAEMIYIKEKASVERDEYPYEVYLNWVYHKYQGSGGGSGGGGGGGSY